MALGFLTKIAEAVSPAADFLKIGAGLYDAFRKHGSKSADQMRAMIGAAVNPDDPRFQNLKALFEAQGKADMLQGINQALTMENRASARGLKVVNPERRDESRYKAISRGFQDVGRQAGLQAQSALMGGGQAIGGLTNYDVSQDAAKSLRHGAVAEGIADLLASYKPPPVADQEYAYYTPRKALGYTEF